MALTHEVQQRRYVNVHRLLFMNVSETDNNISIFIVKIRKV